VVPLAGLALGDESPIVRVTATGAPVQATLQSSITRGLVPGGVDQVAAVTTAETTQVVPGVTVTQSPGAEDASDAASVLRLLAPEGDTTAQVSVVDASGREIAEPQIALRAGIPVEVELGALEIGAYTVRVDAGSPVVAAVWQAAGFGVGADFAWFAAAPAIADGTIVAVPEGPDPTLWVYNPSEAELSVDVESLSGSVAATLRIPAGEARRQSVASGDVYRIDPAGSAVHAAVAFGGEGALAGLPVWPAASAAGSVVVYP
jgi:hypothetical protein